MKKKVLLEKFKNQSFCRIKPSGIHGVGVFAIKDILENVSPWSTDSHAGLEIHQISNLKLKKLDKPVKDMLYDYNLKSDHGLFVPPYELEIFHITQFLNSSKEPNLKLTIEERATAFGTVIDSHTHECLELSKTLRSTYKTIRNIKAGEELTVDFENDLKNSGLKLNNL